MLPNDIARCVGKRGAELCPLSQTCLRPQFTQLGRGYRMYAGCKQWVCNGCKAEIDARRKAKQ